MATSRWERFAPLTGALFVLFTAAGIVVTWSDSPEDFPAPVDQIVKYYNDSTDAILAGAWLGMLGSFFLIWFGGSVRARLSDAGEERLATVAFGGAVAAATVGLMVDAFNVMGALRADEDDKIDPQTATAVYDLGNGLIGSALPAAIAVLIAATSVVALRTGALPKWLGIFGAIVTVGLLILPIAFWFTAIALIWALVTSIVLYTSQPAEPPAAAT